MESIQAIKQKHEVHKVELTKAHSSYHPFTTRDIALQI